MAAQRMHMLRAGMMLVAVVTSHSTGVVSKLGHTVNSGCVSPFPVPCGFGLWAFLADLKGVAPLPFESCSYLRPAEPLVWKPYPPSAGSLGLCAPSCPLLTDGREPSPSICCAVLQRGIARRSGTCSHGRGSLRSSVPVTGRGVSSQRDASRLHPCQWGAHHRGHTKPSGI